MSLRVDGNKVLLELQLLHTTFDIDKVEASIIASRDDVWWDGTQCPSSSSCASDWSSSSSVLSRWHCQLESRIARLEVFKWVNIAPTATAKHSSSSSSQHWSQIHIRLELFVMFMWMWSWRTVQIGPHQVAYQAVAPLIHVTQSWAWAVVNIILYYRNQV